MFGSFGVSLTIALYAVTAPADAVCASPISFWISVEPCVLRTTLILSSTSDWPVGDTDPVGFVERCRVLEPADVEMVVGGTIAGLLGLTSVDEGLGVIQS